MNCCDPVTRMQLLTLGVPEATICAMECHNNNCGKAAIASGTFNWAVVLQLLIQYGLPLLAQLLAGLNVQPMPAPAKKA